MTLQELMTKVLKKFRNLKQKLKTAKGRKIASTRWLERHLNDPYVALAKKQGYRSRAAFKLEEIDDKFQILRGAKAIVDLGCAPGGWLQVAQKRAAKDAVIVGIDLLEIDEVAGTQVITADFTDYETHTTLMEMLGSKPNIILSDMGANSIGEKEIDHLRSVNLVETAFEFVKENLNKHGHFITKLLRGKLEEGLLKEFKNNFASVRVFKPKSSYSNSSEIYVVCKDFRI
jgi:23S rRNA (uridine2552-2'-O)-methyltransferase